MKESLRALGKLGAIISTIVAVAWVASWMRAGKAQNINTPAYARKTKKATPGLGIRRPEQEPEDVEKPPGWFQYVFPGIMAIMALAGATLGSVLGNLGQVMLVVMSVFLGVIVVGALVVFRRLGFWNRWGKLIIGLIAVVLAAFIIASAVAVEMGFLGTGAATSTPTPTATINPAPPLTLTGTTVPTKIPSATATPKPGYTPAPMKTPSPEATLEHLTPEPSPKLTKTPLPGPIETPMATPLPPPNTPVPSDTPQSSPTPEPDDSVRIFHKFVGNPPSCKEKEFPVNAKPEGWEEGPCPPTETGDRNENGD